MVNKKLGGRGWYKCVKFFCQFRLRVLWARINRGSALCQLARYTEGKDERETFPQDGMMKGIIRPDVYLEVKPSPNTSSPWTAPWRPPSSPPTQPLPRASVL